ncbi:MAG: DUF1127 domain-containing protein [Acetobacteraceae bacterium]
MSGSFLTHHFVIAPPARAASRTAAAPRRRGPMQRVIGSRWARFGLAWRRYRSRLAIARLDGHLLRDIGVTYAEAEHEANKPFWQG